MQWSMYHVINHSNCYSLEKNWGDAEEGGSNWELDKLNQEELCEIQDKQLLVQRENV